MRNLKNIVIFAIWRERNKGKLNKATDTAESRRCDDKNNRKRLLKLIYASKNLNIFFLLKIYFE